MEIGDLSTTSMANYRKLLLKPATQELPDVKFAMPFRDTLNQIIVLWQIGAY